MPGKYQIFKNIEIKNLILVLVLLSIPLFIIIFKLIKYSEESEFCGKCHSMEEQYKNWSHMAHKNIKCIDCHLPNDNIFNHYVWKGIDGVKDVVSETLSIKDDYEIHLSEHGKKVLQQNCIRCHSDIVSHINTNRNCFECHRNISHKMITNFCNFNSNGGADIYE
jgi:cytochrome c nitrite reductase small subunit